MAKILIITDTPIERSVNTSAMGIVNTMSTQVEVVFIEPKDIANGWVNKLRGIRADLVLIPETLKLMEEIHKPLLDSLVGATEGDWSKVIYYENKY